ncbi:DEAD/DEAH box helicase family protein [Candidatus Pacearchaeota archaeon]|nr:DEAD/DEAH box helicase family protein [Candidatus Pacearchaeota archaeon]
MSWSLYQNEKFLAPLKFSSGKSQEDVVEEVLNAVKEGNKIIFIHGICGTGKSAIALNIAKNLGKTSIVVPGKNLQNQYKKDYEGDKYLLKEDGEKLKIRVITGRNNHKCKFLEENQKAIPKVKKEINLKLHDIFAGKRNEIEQTIGQDLSADNPNIPCKIEIKEKNAYKIKQYLKQNKKVKINNFSTINDVKRISIASVCPYWSPVLPDKYELKNFDNQRKRRYTGLDNTGFIFYQRKFGCKFYEQFHSFIDADVIVFNSLKYKLESLLNRKPATEVEIIDECDEFLDSFSNQKNINLDRFQTSLLQILDVENGVSEILKEIREILKQIKINPRIGDAVESYAIIPLRETGIYDLLKILLNSKEILDGIDEENYVFDVEETARMFEDFLDETYVTFHKKEGRLIASLVTTNLAKKFKEMVNKNKLIILMSGTIHSEHVLKNIFGLDEFKIIEAETLHQGTIEIKKTELERDCKYSNFSSGKITRKDYLKALEKCVKTAQKPILVHINAFADLPSEKEIDEFEIENLISREKIKEMQENDKTGKGIEKFKQGGIDVLFSTRCARGIDFPGDQCKSIIFTKYPNPNVQNSFWRILMKTKPQHYWDFYKDKARRELWQKVYRGLRFKEDHIYLLSPDSRVLEAFEK